jgi:hypothetical protein
MVDPVPLSAEPSTDNLRKLSVVLDEQYSNRGGFLHEEDFYRKRGKCKSRKVIKW